MMKAKTDDDGFLIGVTDENVSYSTSTCAQAAAIFDSI